MKISLATLDMTWFTDNLWLDIDYAIVWQYLSKSLQAISKKIYTNFSNAHWTSYGIAIPFKMWIEGFARNY